MVHAGLLAETINIQGHHDDLIDAYFRPPDLKDSAMTPFCKSPVIQYPEK